MQFALVSYLSSFIALVKYLDIYCRDFGINCFTVNDMRVYHCTCTIPHTVWYCTIPGKTTDSPWIFYFLVVFYDDQKSYGTAGRVAATRPSTGRSCTGATVQMQATVRPSITGLELECHVVG